MPHPVRLGGVELGDIGLPLAGLNQWQRGGSPYDVRLRGSNPSLYPLPALIALAPLKVFPIRAIVPVFIGLSSFALAFAIARNGAWWQLLIFLSPAYWSAVHSVQWSPLLTAAVLLPPLLPLACVKPQLGVVLAASGGWSKKTVSQTIAFLALSIALRPRWPVEWIRFGNLRTFNGNSPVMIFPGVLLLFAVVAWREREGRLLLALSLVVQRYFYDQLPLYLVPRTWPQMVTLLASSWITVAIAASFKWIDLQAGAQRRDVWTAIIIGIFIPALVMLLAPSRRGGAPVN